MHASTNSGDFHFASDPAPRSRHDAQPTCRTLSANISFLTTATSSGAGPQLQQQIAHLQALETAAPPEIRNAVTTVADFDQHILDTVSAGHHPHIRETPQLTNAISHIVTWIAGNCR